MMQTNPMKFQYIMFTRNNDLDVYVDRSLGFREHISYICNTAGRGLSALARLSTSLNTKSKLCLMKSFILCHYNYCPTVWHFCSVEDTRKIEKVQYRALKYVYNDFNAPYCELRERSQMPLLFIQRQNAILTETYCIYNNIRPTYLHCLLQKREYTRDTRNVKALVQPMCKTSKYGLNSFRYQAAKLWNELDPNFKSVSSLDDFKKCIQSWTGAPCTCSSCIVCVLIQT